MAHKVFLDAGHGGRDSGAAKYITEKKVNLVMALACRDYLEEHGVKVKMSRTSDKDTTAAGIIKACNSFDPELAVSIHNNAGGGDGFEVYHTISGGKGKMLAKNIETEVKKIGQNSRGLKTKKGSNGDYYFFIRETNCPAVICEGVFVDNKKDAAQADTKKEQRAFGYAYARGILKTLGVKDKGLASSNTDKKSSFKVKVTADELNIRKGAGTNYDVVGSIKDKGIYTITDVNGKWGKLKSGKGWINLNYTKKL